MLPLGRTCHCTAMISRLILHGPPHDLLRHQDSFRPTMETADNHLAGAPSCQTHGMHARCPSLLDAGCCFYLGNLFFRAPMRARRAPIPPPSPLLSHEPIASSLCNLQCARSTQRPGLGAARSSAALYEGQHLAVYEQLPCCRSGELTR